MPLSISAVESQAISPSTLLEICELCTEAYEGDFTGVFETLGPGVHVIGRFEGQIVSHAMWVARALQPGRHRPLRTAYVEAVATKPRFQHRGFARQILEQLAQEIRSYELGALSPSDAAFYARLGWELWRGPLFIRTGAGLVPTPDEPVMILRLENTPVDLDLNEPLSAEWRAGELW
ncbi:MAG: GNAT family N-acetyltransferase [Cyanobacteria bacterium]|nr:GNAT family N-acetyltransferase [Cyanobacteriota bacterium]